MTILVIDDNSDNLIALKAVVADRLPDVMILTASSGPQGIASARANDPDVILLDIVMPGMDGYEVCRLLKEDERLRCTPVLFLTALRTNRESRLKALEAGAEGFLTKPFDDIELCSQIQAMAKIKAAILIQRNDKERLARLVEERTRALQQSQASMLNLLSDLQSESAARNQGDEALKLQLEELSRWQSATLGRERRIGELKREVNALAARLGEALPYATPEELEQQLQQ